MYDSILLGKTQPKQIRKTKKPLEDQFWAEGEKPKDASPSKKKKKQQASKSPRKSLTREHTRSPVMVPKPSSSTDLAPVNLTTFHTRATSVIKEKMSEPSSSACSHRQILDVQGNEIEVLKGHKTSKLSPITRKLNY